MKKAIVIILSSIVLITGITFVIVYNIGEMVLDDVISNEINNDYNVVDSTVENDKNSVQNDDNDNGNNELVNNSGNVNDNKTTDDSIAKKKPKKRITLNEIKDIKNKITTTDKLTAAIIVLKRLSFAEINTIKNSMVGGITPEEKKEIRRIVYSKFTSDEINTLHKIFRKYVA